jgi:hypothetical protein
MTGSRTRTDRARYGSERRADIGATLLRGLVAGAAGVAAMTIAEKVEQRLTGRPNSFVPAHTLRRLLGLSERPDRERVALNWTMHWGQGIALGPLRMLMAERDMQGAVASFLFLNVRLASDQTLENLTGAGALPWTWPRDEQRIDLLHKAIYAFVSGAVADRLAQDAGGSRRHGYTGDGPGASARRQGRLREADRPRRAPDAGERRRTAMRPPARDEAPNRAYGVRVSVPGRSDLADVPVLVVAGDEQDAMLLAAEAAGPKAQAEVFRELTEAEIREYGLDLGGRGRVTALPVLAL